MLRIVYGVSMTVELELEVVHETADAILVFDGDDQIWIPKSLLDEWPEVGETKTIEIPEWFAEEKGLV